MKRSIRLLLPLLVVVAMITAACTSSGSKSGGSSATPTSVLDQVIKSGTLNVAVLPDFPPASSQAANGEFEGYEPDIARALAKALGVKLQLVSTNGDTRLPLLQSHRVDVNISSYTATNARAKSVMFTIPYLAQGVTIVFQKDHPITSYSELNKPSTKVAVARGSLNDTTMAQDFPKGTVVRFDTIADVFAAITAGKVDAGMESTIDIASAIAKNPKLATIDAPSISSVTMSMGILPGDPTWLNYLNNFIRNLIISGELSTLYTKWFHAPIPDSIFVLPPNFASK